MLLRGTSLAAFSSVALAVAALVITLALMNGYSRAIATALQRGNAHMVGFALGSMPVDEAHDLAVRLEGVDGVRRATPVTYLTGLLDDPNEPTNPIPVTLKAVADPPSYTGFDTWPPGQGLVAVLGKRIADQVGLGAGDRATVRLPPDGRSWILPALSFQVVGTFSLSFADFDEGWIRGAPCRSSRRPSRVRRRGDRNRTRRPARHRICEERPQRPSTPASSSPTGGK